MDFDLNLNLDEKEDLLNNKVSNYISMGSIINETMFSTNNENKEKTKTKIKVNKGDIKNKIPKDFKDHFLYYGAKKYLSKSRGKIKIESNVEELKKIEESIKNKNTKGENGTYTNYKDLSSIMDFENEKPDNKNEENFILDIKITKNQDLLLTKNSNDSGNNEFELNTKNGKDKVFNLCF